MEHDVLELPSFQPLPAHQRADRRPGELVVFRPPRREVVPLPSKYTVVLHPPPQPSDHRGIRRAVLVTMLAAAGVAGYCVPLDPDNPPPTMLSVEMAVAAPVAPAVVAPPKVPTQAHIDAVRRGEALLLDGDIVAARSFFTFAYNGGLTYAAKWVARTYDPDYLTAFTVGFRGDSAKAKEWYSKAAEDSAPLSPDR